MTDIAIKAWSNEGSSILNTDGIDDSEEENNWVTIIPDGKQEDFFFSLYGADCVHLYDLDYRGCISCFGCKRKGAVSCRYMKDDLTPILEKVQRTEWPNTIWLRTHFNLDLAHAFEIGRRLAGSS